MQTRYVGVIMNGPFATGDYEVDAFNDLQDAFEVIMYESAEELRGKKPPPEVRILRITIELVPEGDDK